MTRLLPWAVVLMAAAACTADRPRPARAPARADKASVFGDAALVPTREGERAREQLARAGQIERALAVLEGVEAAAVDVGPLRATVVVRATAAAGDPVELERTIATIARPIAGTEVAVVVQAAPEVPETPSRATWPLVVAVLGFGVSLGVTAERLRTRPGARVRRRPSA